jgi:hypothetical protein
MANMSSGIVISSSQGLDAVLGISSVTDFGGVECVERRPLDGVLNVEPDIGML